MKVSTVITITILALHVNHNVKLVWIVLTTVLNVSLQESMLHNVLAQMDTLIMVTLVLVVLTNVELVLLEKIVPPVLISDLTPQNVNVQKDIMIPVKLNVNYVTGNVLLVILTTSVLLVTTQMLECYQIVNVQKVGKMLKMVPLLVKKWPTQKD
jgi:hypothetical protein